MRSRFGFGLVLVSAAVLTLEILDTKILAYALDAVTLYIAIGVCLLGLGASATLRSLRPALTEAQVRPTAAAWAVAGGILVVASHAVFAHTSDGRLEPGWRGLATLLVLTAPFFCLGMAVTIVFVARATSIGTVYALNLAGSAIGCVVVFPLLDGLGAERGLLAVATLAIAGAVLLSPLRFGTATGVLAAATIAGLLLAARASEIFPFQPEATGQLQTVMSRVEHLRREHPEATVALRRLYSRWDRTARVDVYQLDTSLPELQGRIDGPVQSLLFAQDASAGSFLMGVGDDLERGRGIFEHTLYGLGYALGSRRDVLVIGLGGAPDVLTALYHGAARIDAVDINGAAIRLVEDDFRSFLGDPYHRPGVTVHRVDGRAFLQSAAGPYDLVQMSGVDTKAIFAAGGLAVNENYIYTREAFRDALARLKPDGMLAVLRVVGLEPYRLAALGAAALRDLGAASPERHIFTVRQGLFSATLVKRSPYTDEELDKVLAWVAGNATPPQIVMPMHEWIGLSFRSGMQVLYSPPPRPVTTAPFFEALAHGTLDDFLAASPIDFRPPVDDRPFFWNYSRPREVLLSPGPLLRPLHRFIGRLALVSAVLILLPVVVLRWRGLGAPQSGRSLVYFGALGMGFMLVEIGLIQRFVLLLGHQSYAVSVVLCALLVGAGTGSVLSARLGGTNAGVRAAVIALVAVIGLYAVALGPVLASGVRLDFGSRLGLALVFLVPLGVLLGLPFPSGIDRLRGGSRVLVPWAIAVNGFASVVGSTSAVPLAMAFGLRNVLLFGGTLYLVALGALPRAAGEGKRRSPDTAAPCPTQDAA